jgi:hypothetical protein
MLDGMVEEMPSWLKGLIAIGTGTVAGVATAKLLMMLGMGHG